MYFAPSIFKAANFAQSSALFQTALIGIVYLTFSLLAMFFVDKVGRKPLMIIGSRLNGYFACSAGTYIYYKSYQRLFGHVLYHGLYSFLWLFVRASGMGAYSGNLP